METSLSAKSRFKKYNPSLAVHPTAPRPIIMSLTKALGMFAAFFVVVFGLLVLTKGPASPADADEAASTVRMRAMLPSPALPSDQLAVLESEKDVTNAAEAAASRLDTPATP